MEGSEQFLIARLLSFNAQMRSEIATIRMQMEFRRREAETKYNPNWRNQPRAPRGVAEGGQWTSGGATSRLEPSSTRTIPTAGGNDERDTFDTNGIPTAGWAEPDWQYPAFPQTSTDGEPIQMSPETELAMEAVATAFNAIEEFNYRRVMGRSAEDSYELRLQEWGVPYYREVRVMTREGLRIYDFLQRGPLGWEFVEIKANRAIATPRQIKIDTAVQIFGFSIVSPTLFYGVNGPANVRLMRTIPSDIPFEPE